MTETTPNPIPGTEVTQTPGLIPETTTDGRPDLGPDTTYTENDGSTGNIAPPPLNIPNVVLPPSVTGTEWDGTIAPPPYTTGQSDITEVPPTDYAAAVDHLVDTMPESHHPDMPTYTESEVAHQQMMRDPAYAVATHEHTLNKVLNMLEEIVGRLQSIEDRMSQHEQEHFGPDPNDLLASYPEVQHHQHGSQHYGGSPGLTV